MKYDAVFFSPHLDDAVLSGFAVISKFLSRRKSVLIVTCFTHATDSPISKDGLDFIKKSGGPRPSALFVNRRKEDVGVAQVMGFDHLHLSFVDGLYRWYPTTSPMLSRRLVPAYPSYQALFSGTISSLDRGLLFPRVETRMSRIVDQCVTRRTRIFGPLGVGLHADHLLVFEVLHRLPRWTHKRIQFWEDIPYNKHPLAVSLRLSQIKKPYCTHTETLSEREFQNKIASVKRYSSQLTILFPDNDFQTLRRERYYTLQ